MNKFQIAENIGRELLHSWLNFIEAKDIEFTKGKYDPVDCNFTFKGSKVSAEIKVRNEVYKDFNTHMMELNKLIGMNIYIKDHNKDLGLYINFFGDNWCYVYQIHKLEDLIPVERKLQRTTSVDNGYTDKDILYLPVEIANIYNRENKESEWKKLK